MHTNEQKKFACGQENAVNNNVVIHNSQTSASSCNDMPFNFLIIQCITDYEINMQSNQDKILTEKLTSTQEGQNLVKVREGFKKRKFLHS